MPTEHWVESLTGLGATGVELSLYRPAAPGPLVPVPQVAADRATAERYANDTDAILENTDSDARLFLDTLGRETEAFAASDLQMTRGLLGS